MKQRRLRFRPAGDCALDVWGKRWPGHEKVIRTQWEKAESFGVVIYAGSRIVPGVTGKAKVRGARSSLAFLPLPPTLVSPYWAEAWPGTWTGNEGVVVVTGKVANASFETFFQSGSSTWWPGGKGSGWEDLFLFTASKLHYFTCSHESFGAAFDDEAGLVPHGSSLRPVKQLDRELVFRGEAIEQATWDRLTGPVL